MLFDQHRLRYFVAIAEEGSLSAAAERMHVAQPALSYHLAFLERQLDLKLFDRHARGMSLTPAGSRYLEHARRILADINSAELDLRQLAQSGVARVTLGLLSASAPFLTPHLLRAIADERPLVSVDVIEGDSVALHNMVRAEKVDLAFNLADAVGPDVPSVASEDLYLVGPANSIFGRRRTVTLREALQVRLILPGRPNRLRMLIEKGAAQAGQRFDVALQIDGIVPVKQAVAAGFGYTITSWPVVEREHATKTLRIHRIVQPNLSRNFVIETLGALPAAGPKAQLHALLMRVLRRLGDDASWPGKCVPLDHSRPVENQGTAAITNNPTTGAAR
jgi:LysR family nitrogen assimilation transcriptional regulator